MVAANLVSRKLGSLGTSAEADAAKGKAIIDRFYAEGGGEDDGDADADPLGLGQ